MLVELSGQRFTFPQQCACCGGYPNTTLTAAHSKTTGKRAVKTKTWSWEFPYCDSCVAHVKTWKNSTVIGCSAGVVLVLISFVVGNETAQMLTILLGLILSIVVIFMQQSRARNMCSATCTAPQPAVEYLHWHGSFHTFNILSRNYAALFMLANAKKLVNVTEDGRQLMQWAITQAGATAVRDEDDAEIRITVSASTPPARATRPSAEDSDHERLVRCLSKLESLKGSASRRAAVEAGMKTITSDEIRKRLLLEASRIEVSAVLDKVDSLKTKSAKKRTLLAAIDEIRADAVADALQGKQIEMLEAALRDVEAEA